MSQLNRLRLAALAALTLTPLLPCALRSQAEELKMKANEALRAGDEGRHEQAYLIWMGLIALGPSRLGEEGLSFARAHAYHEAAAKIAEIGDGNCAKTLEWVEKGKKPGPPQYTHVYDVFYPWLLIAEGVCYAQQGKYEDAYQRLWLSKSELRKAPPEDAAEFMRNADQYLSAVNAHVISEGDYVTNKGVLQAWIGKVVSRSGDEVKVKITYVNKDLSAGLAKETTFSVTDCKALGAISADAALRGWQE